MGTRRIITFLSLLLIIGLFMATQTLAGSIAKTDVDIGQSTIVNQDDHSTHSATAEAKNGDQTMSYRGGDYTDHSRSYGSWLSAPAGIPSPLHTYLILPPGKNVADVEKIVGGKFAVFSFENEKFNLNKIPEKLTDDWTKALNKLFFTKESVTFANSQYDPDQASEINFNTTIWYNNYAQTNEVLTTANITPTMGIEQYLGFAEISTSSTKVNTARLFNQLNEEAMKRGANLIVLTAQGADQEAWSESAGISLGGAVSKITTDTMSVGGSGVIGWAKYWAGASHFPFIQANFFRVENIYGAAINVLSQIKAAKDEAMEIHKLRVLRRGLEINGLDQLKARMLQETQKEPVKKSDVDPAKIQENKPH